MQGALCEEGWDEVHDEWSLILQLGFDQQRRRCRRCSCSLDQRVENRVAIHVKELGPKLAEQFIP